MREFHPNISHLLCLYQFPTSKVRRFTRSLLANPAPWFYNLGDSKNKFFESFEILGQEEENTTERQNKCIRPKYTIYKYNINPNE